MRALVITAAGSGAGKTTLTLGLLRALRNRGVSVAAAKSGPDYIDPAFHEAACGAPSVTLDAWAMSPQALRMRALAQPGAMLLIEGAMGALDGAPGPGVAGTPGSAADLAAALGAPALLVLDVARQGASAALPAAGLRALRPSLPVAGAVLNRVAGDRHAALCREALEAAGISVLGAVPRAPALALPERHLGLVQAGEHADLEAFLERAAEVVTRSVDLAAVSAAAAPVVADLSAAPPYAAAPHAAPSRRAPPKSPPRLPPRLPPLGQRTAVARDAAFAFLYPHLLADWRAQGAEIAFFSPLADEPPTPDADAVFLPGGYPELHGGRLAANAVWRAGVAARAAAGARIYGECGGYMALGDGLVDADGARWPMLGLLPVETSFETRRLSLGYRLLRPHAGAPWAEASWTGDLRGHEFHYATVLREDGDAALFEAWDAAGRSLGGIGRRVGAVSGSFGHVIAPDVTAPGGTK